MITKLVLLSVLLLVIGFFKGCFLDPNEVKVKKAKAKMLQRKFMVEREEEEQLNKQKLEERKERSISLLRKSKYKNLSIVDCIVRLYEDSDCHTAIADVMTDEEIEGVEKELNLSLPMSYKVFLKYFGDGGCWVFNNNVSSIRNYAYLNKYRKGLGEFIELDGGAKVKLESLLCLMEEDSDGGAWCWLTSEVNDSGEWPLAYYSSIHQKLFYKIDNFTEWINILIDAKKDVISVLDKEYKLGLG